MEIKWRNLIALVLLVLLLVLAVHAGPSIRAVLGAVQGLAPGHRPEDRAVALVVLGLLLVTAVAVVRLLVDSDRREK